MSPQKEACIYVCNHRSFADPLVLCRYLDAFVIAKAEVAKYPLINKGAEITGVIYVQRESKESRNAVRDKMIEKIKEGYNVLVFPEGTVGVEEFTIDFRSGTFFEAAEHGVSIVPVAMEFRDDKDLWLVPNFVGQYLAQFSKWSTQVKLSFGPKLNSMDGEFLKNESKKWIDAKLNEMHIGWSRINFDKHKSIKTMYTYKDLN
jgi:1-acyl-sn-glycerol-3-phosphate acyltransferase